MTGLETEFAPATWREPSYPLGARAQWFYLSLLGGALGYAVLQHGGRTLADWNVSLLIIGVAAVGYWGVTPLRRRAPALERLAGYLALLIPAYVALQLVPLPMFLLRILSPERASITDRLRTVMGPQGFAPLSVSPETTVAHWLRMIGYLLVFLVVREVAARSRQRWVAAVPLMAVAALEAALGLAQKAGGEAVSGTYWNRNHFAGLLEMVLPVTIACAITLLKGSGWLRGAIGAGRALAGGMVLLLGSTMLVAVVSTGSKMGFLACFGGLFAMLAVGWGGSITGRKRWWIAGVAGALFVLVFTALPPAELVKALGHAVGDETGEGRVPIWSDSRHLMAAYPVTGSGLGTFDTAFLKYQTAVLDSDFDFAHNDYLQLATETGGLGFLILAGFAATMAVKSWRSGTGRFDGNTRYLAWGTTGAMAAIGLHSFTDFNLYIPANGLALAWILGIVASFPAGSHGAVARGIRWRPVAIGLGCVLLCYAPAWILLEERYKSDPRAEAWFCRFGVCDTAAAIASETENHGGSVASVPEGELLTALRRDPDAAFRWCDLGEARLRAGRVEQARECFSTAMALAPNIPPMRLRAANFYFDIHDGEQGLAQTARVLESSAVYDSAIFDRYGRERMAAAKVLRDGLPRNERAWQSYLRYLMSVGKFADAAAVWDGIISERYGDDVLARDYVGFLFRDHRYEAAGRAWTQYTGDLGHGYLQSNCLYNGDFEAEPSGVEFDWTMEDLNDDVKAAIDSSVAHTGSRSLRIQFGGKTNVNYDGISQRAVVKPGRYRFSAFVRVEGITTDQGVGFRIADGEWSRHLDVRTEQVIGTTDWKKIEQIVLVPAETRLLTIQVIRPSSWRFDSHIAGTAWIDTVSLSRVE
jgi:tetratricopeptide (TPR) repeat protein